MTAGRSRRGTARHAAASSRVAAGPAAEQVDEGVLEARRAPARGAAPRPRRAARSPAARRAQHEAHAAPLDHAVHAPQARAARAQQRPPALAGDRGTWNARPVHARRASSAGGPGVGSGRHSCSRIRRRSAPPRRDTRSPQHADALADQRRAPSPTARAATSGSTPTDGLVEQQQPRLPSSAQARPSFCFMPPESLPAGRVGERRKVRELEQPREALARAARRRRHAGRRTGPGSPSRSGLRTARTSAAYSRASRAAHRPPTTDRDRLPGAIRRWP